LDIVLPVYWKIIINLKLAIVYDINLLFTIAKVGELTRKTIYFSKSEKMHDIVIGLLINKVEL